MFFGFSREEVREYRCPRLRAKRRQDGVFSRQEGIPNFDQAVFSSLRVGVVGAGGLGGEVGEGLVRKGVGSLTVCDYDTVDPTNLNRQFFGKSDLGKNKGLRLARNLSRMGFGGTRVRGVGLSFQQAEERGLLGSLDALVCGVDEENTRVDVSRYGLRNRFPVVFTAVSRDGNNGYVFIQEPGRACYGCLFSEAPGDPRGDRRQRCAPDPAIKDILKVVGGLVLFAADTLFMQRKRNWNYREVFLCGFVGERVATVSRRDDCLFCGVGGKAAEGK